MEINSIVRQIIFIIYILLLLVNSTFLIDFIMGGKKCYDDLGCFSNMGDFCHLIYRPICLNPEEPSKINTTFLLYTSNNSNSEDYISYHKPDTITNSNFNPSEPTKIICHGFLSSANTEWMQSMKDLFLEMDSFNVILVDWSGGNQFPYEQAAANTQLVGREIGNLLKTLQKIYSINMDNVHVIGHSLGAHVAGYAGKWLKDQLVIGRISGLDPAGPLFQYMPTTVKLYYTDAAFVDVIHTSGRELPQTSFGLLEPLGHFDFYPDGGSETDSCDLKDRLTVAFKDSNIGFIVSCNHVRSIDFYRESILSKCPFTSYICDDIQSYLNAECLDSDSVRMGYFAYKKYHPGQVQKKYFLTTSDKAPPFCVFHWIFEIGINQSQAVTHGDFYVSVFGRNSNMTKTKLNTETDKIEGGNTYRYLTHFYNDPVSIISIQFSWMYNILSEVFEFFNSDTISIDFIKMSSLDVNEESYLFCSEKLKNYKIGESIELAPNSSCS